MSIFKRTQRKYVKKAYRVRNWREYEAGLRNRGSLTVWISLTAGKLVNWDAPRPRRRKPGRQRKYSNHAIETAVTLGMVFHLSSRQSEGLLRSLFALMKLDNDVPDHTTLSSGVVAPLWLRAKCASCGGRGMFDHEVSQALPVQAREAEEVPRSQLGGIQRRAAPPRRFDGLV